MKIREEPKAFIRVRSLACYIIPDYNSILMSMADILVWGSFIFKVPRYMKKIVGSVVLYKG